MLLSIQDLKVDQTILPSEGNSGILVTNINIPEAELHNLINVLQRVRQLIVGDYTNVSNIQYQICATYELRNTETGDLRQWTGSFNPRGNQTNTLCPFQTFNANFETIVRHACSEENVLNRLRFYHVQTNWVFHRLTSVIINVQSVVNLTHPTLLRRSLLAQRHGRNRKICTFFLP
jgi:hypothetical protein